MAFRHFKMHLCDVEPVVEMIYEATAAPARAPFGRNSAISVRMHASEIERRRRLSALSRFTWNTATIGGLNISRERGRERTTEAILRHSSLMTTGSRRTTDTNPKRQRGLPQVSCGVGVCASLTRRVSTLGGDVAGAQQGDLPGLMSIEPGGIEPPPAQGIGDGAPFFTDWARTDPCETEVQSGAFGA